MKYPEERFLFNMKDTTHACNMSRTSLIRLEECGFLTPYYVDPDTGYRYYDAQNIAQIGQYQLLQELGLSKKEITCYCETIHFSSMEAGETLAYQLHQNLIQKGYQVNGMEPIFCINSEIHPEATTTKIQGHTTLCFPVIPPKTPDSQLTIYPACHCVSIVAHGDYSIIPALVSKMYHEITVRNLKPNGPSRMIILIAPYVGSHIAVKDYCYEFIVPVER